MEQTSVFISSQSQLHDIQYRTEPMKNVHVSLAGTMKTSDCGRVLQLQMSSALSVPQYIAKSTTIKTAEC